MFIAPEVLSNKPYNEKCDIWSIGVMTYYILCGFEPFFSTKEEELYTKIKNADYKYNENFWEKLSMDSRKFIDSCLKTNASSRPDASELLKHPWIIKYGSAEEDIGQDVKIDLAKNLATYKHLNKFQTACMSFIARRVAS